MKRMLRFFIVPFIAVVFLTCNATAQDNAIPLIAEKAVVLFVKGDVMVETERAGKWIDATVGMTLQRGENLRTGAKSWAEIGVVADRENIFRVQEKTLVSLIDLRPIRVSLLKGEVRSLVQGLTADSSFQIETPTAICGARGTGWDTKTDGKKLTADAYENSISIQAIGKTGEMGKEWTLDEGRRGVLRDPAGELEVIRIPVDKVRGWERWKEDFTDRRSGDEHEKKEMEARRDIVSGAGAGAAQEKAEQVENKTEDVSGIQEKFERIDDMQSKTEASGETRDASAADNKDRDSAASRPGSSDSEQHGFIGP